METGEMTMTSNVPVTVSTNTDASEHKSFEINKPEIVDGEAVKEFDVQDKVSEISHQDSDVSDKVLESAKEEGFLEALKHLADGDYDENAVETDTQENEEKNKKPDRKEKEENDLEEEKAEKVEKEPLIARIKELEGKVIDLEEKNKKLFDQIQTLQENNRLALQTLLEITLIMQALIKEEENSEKKVTLLELLIEMMGELMKKMFVPDDENSRIGQTQKQEPVKKRPKRSISEVMDLLRRKGLLNDSETEKEEPMTAAPNVEMQPA